MRRQLALVLVVVVVVVALAARDVGAWFDRSNPNHRKHRRDAVRAEETTTQENAHVHPPEQCRAAPPGRCRPPAMPNGPNHVELAYVCHVTSLVEAPFNKIIVPAQGLQAHLSGTKPQHPQLIYRDQVPGAADVDLSALLGANYTRTIIDCDCSVHVRCVEPTPAPTPVQCPPPPITVSVALNEFAFVPNNIVVHVGDSVRFTWRQGLHTVSFVPNNHTCRHTKGDMRSGFPSYNGDYRPFPAATGATKAGVYDFMCEMACVYGMRGVITVLPQIDCATTTTTSNASRSSDDGGGGAVAPLATAPPVRCALDASTGYCVGECLPNYMCLQERRGAPCKCARATECAHGAPVMDRFNKFICQGACASSDDACTCDDTPRDDASTIEHRCACERVRACEETHYANGTASCGGTCPRGERCEFISFGGHHLCTCERVLTPSPTPVPTPVPTPKPTPEPTMACDQRCFFDFDSGFCMQYKCSKPNHACMLTSPRNCCCMPLPPTAPPTAVPTRAPPPTRPPQTLPPPTTLALQ